MGNSNLTASESDILLKSKQTPRKAPSEVGVTDWPFGVSCIITAMYL